MTDDEITGYLDDNGYPEHIVRGGSSGLLRRWQEFVGEVERGYRYRLDDYRRDLDLRGVIALAGLDDSAVVAEADERLRPLLIETHHRIWESVAGDGTRDTFWEWGYPRNANRELLRELRSAGLTDS